MNKGFRQSQAFLHTWSGLLLGWVLFLIFVAGTIAFWREGLNRWMQPEVDRIEQPYAALAGAQKFLQTASPDGKNWFITMPSSSTAGAQVFWQPQPKEGAPPARRGRGNRDTQAVINADGQPVEVRATRGGEFFYRFHFDLHYLPIRWARWLVLVASMAMLVAILSGIVTHKKIFTDFFTLRRGKGQRSWLDGHIASAVLSLPFHLMITYTGLVTLMAMLMPWAIVANYTEKQDFSDVLYSSAEVQPRTETPVPLMDITQLVRKAEEHFNGPAGYISVSEPGDAAAMVTVSRAASSMLSSRTPAVTYNGTNGALIWQSAPPSAANVTSGAMIGIHAGRFASDGMRWLYFIAGISGCLMVASGLVLWIVKRREKLPDPSKPHFGFRLVAWLNIAVIAGFPLGISAMLWANRVLPLGMANRERWEIHVLFIAWAVSFGIVSVLREAKAWTVLFAATGLSLMMIPVYNFVATPRGLPTTLAQGDYMLAGIDLTLILFGAAFLATARRVARHRPRVKRRKERSYERAQPAPPALTVRELEKAQ